MTQIIRKTNFCSLLSEMPPFLSNMLFFLIPKQQHDNVKMIDPQDAACLGMQNHEQPFAHIQPCGFKQIEPTQPHPLEPFI